MACAGYAIGAAIGKGVDAVTGGVGRGWIGDVSIGGGLRSKGVAHGFNAILGHGTVIPHFDIFGRDAVVVHRFEVSVGREGSSARVVDRVLESVSAEQNVGRVVRGVGIVLHAPAI